MKHNVRRKGDEVICKSLKWIKGTILVKDQHYKDIGIISTTLTDKMLHAGFAVEISSKKTIQIEDPKNVALFKEKIYKPTQKILISFSGKTSIEANNQEIEQLLKEESITEEMPHIYKRKERIAIFRHKVYAKSQNKCHFCGNKGFNTYSLSQIYTLKNTVTICATCEKQKLDKRKRFLSWLGILELEKRFINHGKIKTVWLYDFDKKERYLIKEENAHQLIIEKMAGQIGGREIQVLYNELSFILYIDERDKRKCYFCEKRGRTIEHLEPKSRGGLTTPKNCVRACKACNREKNNLNLEEYLRLKKT